MAEMFHFKDGSLSKSPGTPGLRDTKQPFGLSASSEKMKEKVSINQLIETFKQTDPVAERRRSAGKSPFN